MRGKNILIPVAIAAAVAPAVALFVGRKKGPSAAPRATAAPVAPEADLDKIERVHLQEQTNPIALSPEAAALIVSREAALLVLRAIVTSTYPDRDDFANFKIMRLEQMSTGLRERFITWQQEADKVGVDIAVVRSVDDRVRVYEMPRVALDIVPAVAKQYLTEDDLSDFRVRMNVRAIEKREAERAKKRG